jgi:formylglycine-generating enzyme required for sulfatase activity
MKSQDQCNDAGSYRVFRGGSRISDAASCRTFFRFNDFSTWRAYGYGLRPVRTK